MKKKQENNFWKDWKTWVIIILTIITFYLYLYFDDGELYRECVDECVLNNNNCVNSSHIVYFPPITYQYVEYGRAESCQWTLESCIRWCKI